MSKSKTLEIISYLEEISQASNAFFTADALHLGMKGGDSLSWRGPDKESIACLKGYLEVLAEEGKIERGELVYSNAHRHITSPGSIDDHYMVGYRAKTPCQKK